MRPLLIVVPGVALVAIAVVAFAPAQQEVDLDTLPQDFRLVEDLRIGHAADPNIGFTSIGDVDIDRDGQVYVFEGSEARIRVYSPTGQLLRTIGRRGQGPGEFTGSIRLGVRGDTVWTASVPPVSRLAIFNRAGTLLSTAIAEGVLARTKLPTFRVGTPGGLPADVATYSVAVFAMRSAGSFVSGTVRSAVSPPGGPHPGDTTFYPIVLWNARGEVTDTIGWDRAILDAVTTTTSTRVNINDDFCLSRNRSCRKPIPQESSDADLYLPFADGRLLIDRQRAQSAGPATIRVTRVALTGDTVYSRSYRYSPLRYTAVIRDSMVMSSLRSGSAYSGAPEGFQPPRAVVNEIVSRMRLSEFRTPVDRTFIARDGALWLGRENDYVQTQRWVLIEPDGRPRGRVTAAFGVYPLWQRGDVVWARVYDADQIQWLVRYRLAQ